MATLTVRNLDDGLARRLRIRAAEHERSANAEHREILHATLAEDGAAEQQHALRKQAAARLAEFRNRTLGRGGPASSVDLLEETRRSRMETLMRGTNGARR